MNKNTCPEINITQLSIRCQQFECDSTDVCPNNPKSVIKFRSTQKTSEVVCPRCGKQVHVYDNNRMRLKDIPIWVNTSQCIDVQYHRYRCPHCGKSFSEDVCFKFPGTRITCRAATWIRELLRWHLPISAVAEITGIHWNTIRNIHKEMMENALEERKKELSERGYKPTYLAVDEFAIHKGHRYATCVMDLVEGDVLWVGKGRSKDLFEKFFQEIDLSYLSEVKAIAMDMNASYNKLVEKYLPHVDIVYDRYHMQAQFGKEVLGAVRLAEAKEHNQNAQRIQAQAAQETNTQQRKELKSQAKQEKKLYSRLKKSRWTLLTNSENLSPERVKSLTTILENHSDLALCYAMKEEMCNLFELTDPEEAKKRWTDWFEGAKASGIPALVRFALRKERRLPGLIAHAKYGITTGRLEGFNNKIKVVKRIAYGYRDEPYFFTLIRYVRMGGRKGESPNFP